MNKMRVLLTGGGTGGHIFPLLAVAQELRKLNKDVDLLYVGANGSLYKKVEKLFSDENIITKTITTGKFRRYFDLRNLAIPFMVSFGFIQSIRIILDYKPTVVFSKGGYGALPVVIAAHILKIPAITHDSDAVAGLTNKILSRFVDGVAVAYKDTDKYFKHTRVYLTGNPVPKFNIQINKEKLAREYSLNKELSLLVVIGGSSGSRTINKTMSAIIPDVLQYTNVIHQTGYSNSGSILKKNQKYAGKYVSIPFMDPPQLHAILAHSDLVISRSGGNAVSEIAKYRKPSILIPLSTAANNEQFFNAAVLRQSQAASLIEESQLSPASLLEEIKLIINDKHYRETMSTNISRFYQENAAKDIVSILSSLDLSKTQKD